MADGIKQEAVAEEKPTNPPENKNNETGIEDELDGMTPEMREITQLAKEDEKSKSEITQKPDEGKSREDLRRARSEAIKNYKKVKEVEALKQEAESKLALTELALMAAKNVDVLAEIYKEDQELADQVAQEAYGMSLQELATAIQEKEDADGGKKEEKTPNTSKKANQSNPMNGPNIQELINEQVAEALEKALSNLDPKKAVSEELSKRESEVFEEKIKEIKENFYDEKKIFPGDELDEILTELLEGANYKDPEVYEMALEAFYDKVVAIAKGEKEATPDLPIIPGSRTGGKTGESKVTPGMVEMLREQGWTQEDIAKYSAK